MKKLLINKRLFQISCFALLSTSMQAQFTFSNSNASLHSSTGVLGSNGNNRSGNSVAVCDMNQDGLDDICHLADNGAIHIEFQQPGGTFTYLNCGTMGASGAWSMCVADVDKNGYKDVITGYGSSLKLMKINATGSMGVTTLPSSGFFVQNMNFMDVNGDGWIDIFACDDNSFSKLYLNNGAGSFPAEAANSVINFDVTAGQNVGSSNDDSGNYGSVWTDFDNDGDVDLYIAHCRQSVTSGTDPRRINKLFVNNGNNVYTESAAAFGLASGDQDWTSAFGDINNDGDFDLFLTKHNTTSRLYTNDGTGNFTGGATVAFGNMPMQSQFEDMDNDGFIDLIITGDNDHKIYRNNGNGTFTNATPANFTISGNTMLSFATGDLNHDGKIDIYGSYGGTYNAPSNTQDDVYWLNTTNNTNHFLTVNLGPSISNNNSLGAKVKIYGSWGVQVREVRAGESYGTSNSMQLHFGLGSSTTVDSVVVNWPSGINSVVTNPVVDQFLNIGEQNPCTLTSASITPSGSTVLCAGQSVTLTAPSGTGYTYSWSTGATTQSIVVTNPGTYAVTVSENSFCTSTSPSLVVTVAPNQTPTVTASSTNLTFCTGGSVTLTSSPASSYLWSNGDTTQSTVITQSGNYSVTTQGTCQSWTSTSTNVNVLASPAPTGNDVTIPAPQSTTLNVTGSSVIWYDAAVGGTQLATGNSYVTPVVSADTAFYAEDRASYGGSMGAVGMKFHSGTSNFSGGTTNAWLIFNVLNPCTLKTVKIYADQPGNRLIELRNSAGTVINSLLVNVAVTTPGTIDSSVITLNFPLTVGTAYQLGTNTAQNQTTLATASPRLRRSNSNVVYPYTYANMVNITGSNQGATLYYYFYDWQIEQAPEVCVSPRTPIHVYMSTVGISTNSVNEDLKVYPNPTSGIFNVELSDVKMKSVQIFVTDLLGKVVRNDEVSVANGELKKQFDLSRLEKGVYLLSFSADGKEYKVRVILD